MTLAGFDIAGVNGSGIISKALTGAFVIAKASEGTSYTDPLHDQFVSKLRGAGRLVGHYHYARPDTKAPSDSLKEADHFVSAAKARPGEIMALDFEKNEPAGVGGQADWPEWVLAFTARVKQLTGASCWVYLNGYFAQTILSNASAAQRDAIRKLPLWKAVWPRDPAAGYGSIYGWPVLTCWQWKGTTIDEDIFYGDANTWRALAVTGSTPQPPEDIMEPRDVSTDLLAWSTVPVGALDPTDGTWSLRTAVGNLVQKVHDLANALDEVHALASAPLSAEDIDAIARQVAEHVPDWAAPPPVVTDEQLREALRVVLGSVDNLAALAEGGTVHQVSGTAGSVSGAQGS